MDQLLNWFFQLPVKEKKQEIFGVMAKLKVMSQGSL